MLSLFSGKVVQEHLQLTSHRGFRLNQTTRIAYFITPHGFGHAARACAVMNAIARQSADAYFDIYTAVPEWVFSESLQAPYTYHDLVTDVGVVQKNALEEDLPATVQQLSRFYPLDECLTAALSQQIRQDGTVAVISDIAPLGLEAARSANLPSFLIENFTWDWIYAGYVDRAPGLQAYIDILQEMFSMATYHIQTRPVCNPCPADLVSGVVSRASRQSRGKTRQALGIEADDPVVLITMGGIAERYLFLDMLRDHPRVRFVIPAAADRLVRDGNMVLLPHHTPLYHPDIVNASDVVVGKLGYSTLSEVYRAGLPFAYVPRPGFREVGPLAAFVQQEMGWAEIAATDFMSGEWIQQALPLLDCPRRYRDEPNGAETIAEFAIQRL